MVFPVFKTLGQPLSQALGQFGACFGGRHSVALCWESGFPLGPEGGPRTSRKQKTRRWRVFISGGGWRRGRECKALSNQDLTSAIDRVTTFLPTRDTLFATHEEFTRWTPANCKCLPARHSSTWTSASPYVVDSSKRPVGEPFPKQCTEPSFAC